MIFSNTEKTKITQKLEAKLGRVATTAEKTNAETDAGILMEFVLEKLSDIQEQIDNIKL